MFSTTIAGLAREGAVGVKTVRYYQRRAEECGSGGAGPCPMLEASDDR